MNSFFEKNNYSFCQCGNLPQAMVEGKQHKFFEKDDGGWQGAKAHGGAKKDAKKDNKGTNKQTNG